MSCEFITQLKKLRKSAPEAIDDANSLDPFKAYLHVENEVECNLRILLRLVNGERAKCLILVCGSAGDGKSHLVAYLKFTDPENLLEGYTLYNDATESDAPTQAALERMAKKLEPFDDAHYDNLDGTNNIAILGLKKHGIETGRKHLITTAIEHKAVLEAAKYLESEGFQLEVVNPGLDGRVSADDILSRVRSDTLLVSVMHVNNETGTIQPVEQIGASLAKTHTLFHIDATQSAGKLIPEIQGLAYNMMSFSSHKMHGPQGVGGLILKKVRYHLPPVRPIMFGGPQEHGIRPGTLPTALIAGLGRACEVAGRNYEEHQRRNDAIKSNLLKLLSESGVAYAINGSLDYGISTTLNISFPGISSEALMLAVRPYCGISNGSACTSSTYQHSHVLSAMGLSDERIESAVRISWDSDINDSELFSEFSRILNIVRDFTT